MTYDPDLTMATGTARIAIISNTHINNIAFYKQMIQRWKFQFQIAVIVQGLSVVAICFNSQTFQKQCHHNAYASNRIADINKCKQSFTFRINFASS